MIVKARIIKVGGTYLDCFGFIGGKLYIGERHHADIISRLIDQGWSYEDLMNAPSLFGWLQHDEPDRVDDWYGHGVIPRKTIYVQIVSDTDANLHEGLQDEKLKADCLAAISKKYKRPAEYTPDQTDEQYVDMGLWAE